MKDESSLMDLSLNDEEYGVLLYLLMKAVRSNKIIGVYTTKYGEAGNHLEGIASISENGGNIQLNLDSFEEELNK